MVTTESRLLKALIKEENNEALIKDQWKRAKSALSNIKTEVRGCNNSEVNIFYDKVVLHAEKTNFITLDIGEIKVLMDNLDVCPKTKKIFNENKLSFSEFLIETLGYSDSRRDFYPSFFADLGVKTCVYCNAQYALTHKRNKELSARYELDHVHSKAIYPYLSITLLNLVPVCGPCNKQKPKIWDLDFNLYTASVEKSAYTFSISPHSRAKYLLNPKNNREILEIKLGISKETDLCPQNLEKVFSLEALYNTQKDLAEEIIIKSQIYTTTYKDMLQKSLRKFELQMTDRIILGTYTEEKDILKRPMTKFAQDIAIDCRLLKR